MTAQIPQNRIVILGAGRTITGNVPSALMSVDPSNRVMDWLLAAFAELPSSEVIFVTGRYSSCVAARLAKTVGRNQQPALSQAL